MREFESPDRRTRLLKPSPPMIGMRQTEFDASAYASGEARARPPRWRASRPSPPMRGSRARRPSPCGLPARPHSMPADAVGAMCELTPASPARLSLAERSAETGAEAVSSAPGPRADPRGGRMGRRNHPHQRQHSGRHPGGRGPEPSQRKAKQNEHRYRGPGLWPDRQFHCQRGERLPLARANRGRPGRPLS